MTDLATLFAPPSADVVLGQLVEKLKTFPVPFTDWHSGSLARTFLQKERWAGLDLVGPHLLSIAAGSFSDSAHEVFLTQVAHSLYGLDRLPGTQARQSVTVKNTSTTPLAIGGADLFVTSDGTIYRPVSGGSVGASGGELSVIAEAVSPGVIGGLVTAFATPITGLVVKTAAIDLSGGSPAYGSNPESDVDLLSRCDARWPSLEALLPEPAEVTWAKVGSAGEITRVKLSATGFANEVRLTVASPAGAVSGGGITGAQAMIDALRPITRLFPVQNCTTLGVSASGAVTVPRGQLAAIQVAADAAWSMYLSSVSIGTFVSLAKFIQIIRDAGALSINAPGLGSVPSIPFASTDLALGSTDVPVPNSVVVGLAAQLNWYEV
jgi:hypothetical protein